ncbi:MAG: hypothetical protein WBF33_15830 [Candidatus Nitrosopolaris sp.]
MMSTIITELPERCTRLGLHSFRSGFDKNIMTIGWKEEIIELPISGKIDADIVAIGKILTDKDVPDKARMALEIFISQILAREKKQESAKSIPAPPIAELESSIEVVNKCTVKGQLYEAIFLSGQPLFVYYDGKEFKTEVTKIQELDRTLIPPSSRECPYEPYDFSQEELQNYLNRAKTVNIDELFDMAWSIATKYNDQDLKNITAFVIDMILSYFQDKLSTIHYLQFVGDNDTGKGAFGTMFEYTGYRVVKATAMTGPNYFRVLRGAGQCTIIEDEADNIQEDIDKMKILKCGYEYGGKIPRTNMNEKHQPTYWYSVYCLKILLAERSMDPNKAKGLVDRTFTLHSRPGYPRYSIKDVIRERGELYNELIDFRKLMLCYRLVHYSDKLPDIETGLINRDRELGRPILQVFHGLSAERKEKVIDCLSVLLTEKRGDRINSKEAVYYRVVSKLIEDGKPTHTVADIYKSLKAETEGNPDIYNRDTHHTEYGVIHLNTITKDLKDKFGAVSCKVDGHRALRFDRERIASFAEKYEYCDYKILCRLKDSKDSSDGIRGCVQEGSTHLLEPSKLSQLSLGEKSNIFQENQESITKIIAKAQNISSISGESGVQIENSTTVNLRNNLYSQGIVRRLVGLESQKSIQNVESDVYNVTMLQEVSTSKGESGVQNENSIVPTHPDSDISSELKEQRIKIVELVRNHSQRQVADILGTSQSAVKRAVEYNRKYELDIKESVTSEERTLDDYQKLKQEPTDGQSQEGRPSKNEVFWDVYDKCVIARMNNAYDKRVYRGDVIDSLVKTKQFTLQDAYAKVAEMVEAKQMAFEEDGFFLVRLTEVTEKRMVDVN